MRLKKSEYGFIPISTGAKNRDMELVTIYIRRDIMDKLRIWPKYSEAINRILAKYLGLE